MRWGKSLFVDFRAEVKRCNARLEQLRGGNSESEVVEFEEVRARLVSILLMEEDHRRQRERVFWLQEGDSNMKFFHYFANGRHKKNKISRLMDSEGDWVTDSAGLCGIARDYFSQIFAKHGSNSQQVVRLIERRVSAKDNDVLLTPFTKAKFKKALFSNAP